MRVIEVINPGPTGKLQIGTRPKPKIGDEEVLVKVHASGVNRADIFQKHGNYNPPSGASDILGLEIAGEVAEIGKNVIGFSLGDKVCGVVKGGGYSEFAAVPASHLLPVSGNFSFTDAASLPEAVLTSFYAISELGKLKACESFLIHGGASGIGSIAIQMAKQLGAEVYATSRDVKKINFIEKFGAKVINSVTQDFNVEIKNETNGKGVNLIIDMVGGDFFQKNLSALSINGRLVQIAFLGGAKLNVDLAPILMKNLSIKSFRLRSLSYNRIARITAKVKETIWPMVANGKIKPVIDSVFNIEDVEKAHEKMESNKNIGKIILKF